MELTDLEKYREELRHQFEEETGSHPFADQKYIKWLEEKLVKESDSLQCVSDTLICYKSGCENERRKDRCFCDNHLSSKMSTNLKTKL